MVASKATISDITDLIERHADDPMELAIALAKIEGNKSFKDTATAIVEELILRGHKTP